MGGNLSTGFGGRSRNLPQHRPKTSPSLQPAHQCLFKTLRIASKSLAIAAKPAANDFYRHDEHCLMLSGIAEPSELRRECYKRKR